MSAEPTPIYDTLQRHAGCQSSQLSTFTGYTPAALFEAERCHLPRGHSGWHDNRTGTQWTP